MKTELSEVAMDRKEKCVAFSGLIGSVSHSLIIVIGQIIFSRRKVFVFKGVSVPIIYVVLFLL